MTQSLELTVSCIHLKQRQQILMHVQPWEVNTLSSSLYPLPVRLAKGFELFYLFIHFLVVVINKAISSSCPVLGLWNKVFEPPCFCLPSLLRWAELRQLGMADVPNGDSPAPALFQGGSSVHHQEEIQEVSLQVRPVPAELEFDTGWRKCRLEFDTDAHQLILFTETQCQCQ